MTNIEKEIITYQILTRGTAAELGAPAQDPQAWVEANAAYHSGTSYRGTLLGMVTRVLKRFKSNKSWGPDGPHSPHVFITSLGRIRGMVLFRNRGLVS
jgi:hypothetical protein